MGDTATAGDACPEDWFAVPQGQVISRQQYGIAPDRFPHRILDDLDRIGGDRFAPG